MKSTQNLFVVLSCVVFSVLGTGQQVKQQTLQIDYVRQKEMLTFLQASAVDNCTQRRGEKPANCSCTDTSGHTFTRQAQCYSCYNPVNGQKCGGPYCYSCYTVCQPGGVPPQNPGPC
jgi:hypothetical protein